MNHNKKLDFRKRWLQWVLDFIQTDLNSLSKANMKRLVLEVFYFSSDVFGMDWEDYEYKSTYQAEKYDMVQALNKQESELPRIQEKLKSFIYAIEEVIERPMKDECNDYIPLRMTKVTPTLHIIQEKGPNEAHFAVFHDPADKVVEGYAFLHLAKLIDGLNIGSIRKCKGCNRLFLNLTRIEKIYCNSSCAARSIARMKREELKKDPEKYQAYLEKQKKLMRKRYREMRRAQFLPNNRIRIGRKED